MAAAKRPKRNLLATYYKLDEAEAVVNPFDSQSWTLEADMKLNRELSLVELIIKENTLVRELKACDVG
jgi:hypothetical protein